jgi:hypothetical protein
MTTADRPASRALGPGFHRVIALALAGVAVAVGVSVGALPIESTGSPPNSAPSKAPTSSSSHAKASPPRSSSANASSVKYGQIPSWLPKPKVRVGRTAVATAARPWLAIEGDTVSVRLAHGRVLATAVGPAVPEEGRFPVPATTRCTFTIIFTAAYGAVPLSAKGLTITDEYGHLHHPRVTATGGGAPPPRVAAGRTVSLTVNDVLPTGNGRLRWAPQQATPIVSWDFDVEID